MRGGTEKGAVVARARVLRGRAAGPVMGGRVDLLLTLVARPHPDRKVHGRAGLGDPPSAPWHGQATGRQPHVVSHGRRQGSVTQARRG